MSGGSRTTAGYNTPEVQAEREGARAAFGQIVRQRRKEMGLIQRELAAEHGRQEWWLRDIEHGKTDVAIVDMAWLMWRLGIELVPVDGGKPVFRTRGVARPRG